MILIYVLIGVFIGELGILSSSNLSIETKQIFIGLVTSIIIIIVLLLYRLNELRVKLLLNSFFISVVYFLSVLNLHGISGYSNSSRWFLAHQYLDKAEDAIAEYKKTEGSCPSSISDLPGYPLEYIDPFNSREHILKYVNRDGLCIIYSIGLDRFDNNAEISVHDYYIEKDWESSHLSFSVFNMIYKAHYDQLNIRGDIIRRIEGYPH